MPASKSSRREAVTLRGREGTAPHINLRGESAYIARFFSFCVVGSVSFPRVVFRLSCSLCFCVPAGIVGGCGDPSGIRGGRRARKGQAGRRRSASHASSSEGAAGASDGVAAHAE